MDATARHPAESRRRDSPWIGDALAIATALGLYAFHVVLFFRYVNDDAFITFRYSRFLASGLGPYFNVGEHVEGYTNFLHMLLMAAVYALFGEGAVPRAARLVGVASAAGALILGYAVGRTLAREAGRSRAAGMLAGGLAAGLVAVFPGYALNSLSGLETASYALLVTLAVYLGLRGRLEDRWRGAGVAWAAAALARPEGAFIFGCFWIACVLANAAAVRSARAPGDTPSAPRKTDWRTLVPRRLIIDAWLVALVVVAHVAFRLAFYDGEWLPNTYYAKAEGFLGHTPWAYVRHGALAPFLGPLGVALGLAGWWQAGRAARVAFPVAAVALAGAFLPYLTGSDWMPGWRFSVPYLPLLGVIVALGWLRLLRPLVRRLPWLGPVAASVLLVAAAVSHQGERRQLAQRVALRAQGYETGHRRLAAWIRDGAARPGDAVALMDVGIVGYYCPEQRILDITGLTDRHIAKSPGPFLAKTYDPDYILEQRPEIIVLVLTARGDAAQPLRDDRQIATWIRTEARIFASPGFQASYVRKREPPPDAPWEARLAARVGAERVFPHAYPGQYYLLAAFRRRDPGS